MNTVVKFLSKVSVIACSTFTLLTASETVIQAVTITGNFDIVGLSDINSSQPALDDIVVGRFTGEDLDENGILSESELTDFSADIIGEGVTSSIEQLDFDNLFRFELDLNQLDFEIFAVKQVTSDDKVPNSLLCAELDDEPCLLDKIVIDSRKDRAYFFDYEYFSVIDIRTATFVEASILSMRNFNPPTISVSLTSVPPQTIPEPSLVLGILAVLGLGTQLKKIH